MQRVPVAEREDWKETARAHGFHFHSIDDDPYWDESAYYRFTLRQIEDDLEDPVEDIEKMCFAVVERAVKDEEILRRLAIPEVFWDHVRDSWFNRHRNLYGRMDFSYDGHGPAKLLEYNADTPTTLYESSIFQWTWLEQAMERGLIPDGSDQFNSLHERLLDALARFGIQGPLHVACARDSEEDKGTVEYVEDCARQAGLDTHLVYMEDIGIDGHGQFTDLDDRYITTLFKLYPWEWIMAEDFGLQVLTSETRFIEPAWKAILSNKGALALLWEMFEDHPNLLPTYFADDPRASALASTYVTKPLLSREGQNIEIVRAIRYIAGYTRSR
jgi:glutathionylspermidine synthase